MPSTLTEHIEPHGMVPGVRSAQQRPDRTRGVAPQLWVVATFSAFTALVSVFFWPGQMDPDSMDEQIDRGGNGSLQRLAHAPPLRLVAHPVPARHHQPRLGTGCRRVHIARRLLSDPSSAIRPRRVHRRRSRVLWRAPVLSWGVHIGRDAWFIGFLMCAFGFAARAVRMGDQQRRFNLVATLVFAFLCSASWQIGLAPLLVLFVVLASRYLPTSVRRRNLAAVGVGLAMCVGLFGLQIGLERAINTVSTNSQQGTFVYDLGQLSKMNDKVLFPRDVLIPHKRTLAYLKTVPVGQVDGIIFGPTAVVEFFNHGAQLSSLQHAWFSAIAHHPWDYVKERTDLAIAQLSISHPSYWTFQAPPDTDQFRPLAASLRQDGLNYPTTFTSGGNLYGDLLHRLGLPPPDRGIGAASHQEVRITGRCHRCVRTLHPLVELAVFFAVPGLVYRYSYPIVVAGTVLAPVLLPHPAVPTHGARRCRPPIDGIGSGIYQRPR